MTGTKAVRSGGSLDVFYEDHLGCEVEKRCRRGKQRSRETLGKCCNNSAKLHLLGPPSKSRDLTLICFQGRTEFSDIWSG